MPNRISSRPERKPVSHRLSRWIGNLPKALRTEILRWYSFNKQKIPMVFLIVAGFVFTAFLDFTLTLKGDNPPIVFESHISAIMKFVSSPLANMTGFLLFGIYLIGIIQMFNGITFAKKRSPTGLLLINALALIQIVFVVLYTLAFFAEAASRTDYVINAVARRSYTIMIVGGAIMTCGAISSWFYVDWHYVKEIED